MKKIGYKVSGGKLLRLQIDIEENIIINIKINGDFFVYPEESISEIEKFLIGKNVFEIDGLLQDFLNRKKIEIIGFLPKDLKQALSVYNEIT